MLLFMFKIVSINMWYFYNKTKMKDPRGNVLQVERGLCFISMMQSGRAGSRQPQPHCPVGRLRGWRAFGLLWGFWWRGQSETCCLHRVISQCTMASCSSNASCSSKARRESHSQHRRSCSLLQSHLHSQGHTESCAFRLWVYLSLNFHL